MIGVLLMLLCSVLVAGAAYLFKLATRDTSRPMLKKPLFWAGFWSYMLSFGCNALAFRHGAITLLLPLLELSVLWSTLMAVLLLKEHPSPRTLLGAALVMAGSIVLGLATLSP